jgi:DNA-binding CsgD family transcriptional regulator
MQRVEGDGLLERCAEFDRVASAVDDACAGSGRLVVVEGEAGIGKTALLGAARAMAERAGLAVYAARGAELEGDFGFGVVRQLFERRLGTADRDAFGGPAAIAAPLLGVTLGGGAPAARGPAEATTAVVRGLYWLTANLARRRAVALIVDDAQWSDAASLRFLGYLTGRLEGLGVLVLVAARPPEGESALTAVIRAPQALVLRPQALSVQGADRLVRDAVPQAADELCRACHAASGGNPFFLGELAAALRETTGASDVAGLVPATVTEAVAARIARLPGDARELARAIALLGGSAVLLRHAAALADLGVARATTAADRLAVARIVEEGRPLSFVHPIVRAAVYGELSAGRRADGHERAARLLAGEDAPLERIAAHLLATEPRGDSWICEQLVRAADEALARGAPEAATRALRRALAEPPAPSRRAGVLIALGTAEMLTLDTEPAVEHLSRGVQTSVDPGVRLRGAMLLGGLLAAASRVPEGADVLDHALEQAADADPALVGEAEGQLVNIARLHPQTRRRVAARAARLRDRVESGADVTGTELATVAADMIMAGECAQRTAELALRAAAKFAVAPSFGDFSVYYPARCLVGADQLDEAQDLLAGLLAAARRRGDDFETIVPLAYQAELALRRGDLAGAEADVRAALALTSAGWVGVPAMAAVLAAILLENERLDEARSILGDAGITGPGGALPATFPVAMALHQRGRVRLAEGDAAAAARDLLECGRRVLDAGEPNPTLVDWRSCASVALTALRDHDRARGLVEEELMLARRFGAPRAIALALRARATLDDVEDVVADLREAAAILDGSPAHLARAHVLGDLGAALLDRGQRIDARETLRGAAEVAHRCGATALTRRALADLRRTGARPRRAARTGPAALTPAQRRVAELAARGVANRDIAEHLVVTTRTVEFHLSATYRKLGIRTRAELRSTMADEMDARNVAMSAAP